MNNNSQKSNKKNKIQQTRINYNIRNAYCRVIENGKPPKIMPTNEAIAYAESLNLDLVEIGYDKANNCSNCKVCNYSKFLYEQKKKEKEAKKQVRANKVEIKSIQFSLTIDIADKERMIKHAKDFLTEGNKVKITIRFRNKREASNSELAKNLMKEILSEFNDLAVLDSTPVVSEKEFVCIIKRK